MATITVRALDPVTGEPLFGNGQNNFISDLDAMKQILLTRLKLFQGEWFLNLSDGTPMFQKLLGSSGNPRNIETIINLLTQRLNQTPYVVSVSLFQASYTNRQFVFQAKVITQFGTIYLTNVPASSANLQTVNQSS